MSENDVWAAGSENNLATTEVPDAVATVKSAGTLMMGNLVGYALAGFAQLLMIMSPLIAVLVVGGGVMGVGAALENETVAGVGGILFAIGYFVAILLMIFIQPLTNASFLRAIQAERELGTPVGFMSPINTMTEDMGPVMLHFLATQVIVFVGILFCYVPGLIAALVGMVTFPAVVLKGESIGDSFSTGFARFQDNIGWFLVCGLLFIAAAIAMELTIVGLFFLAPFAQLMSMQMYRALEGEPLVVED